MFQQTSGPAYKKYNNHTLTPNITWLEMALFLMAFSAWQGKELPGSNIAGWKIHHVDAVFT